MVKRHDLQLIWINLLRKVMTSGRSDEEVDSKSRQNSKQRLFQNDREEKSSILV